MFGTKLVPRATNPNYKPSLDRIIPTKGYIPGNIAVISQRANCIKSDATSEEIEAVHNWLLRKERSAKTSPH